MRQIRLSLQLAPCLHTSGPGRQYVVYKLVFSLAELEPERGAREFQMAVYPGIGDLWVPAKGDIRQLMPISQRVRNGNPTEKSTNGSVCLSFIFHFRRRDPALSARPLMVLNVKGTAFSVEQLFSL